MNYSDTVCMGRGIGTGASPIIAKTAKSAGILTIGVITKPFRFEGMVKMKYAEEGIEEMSQSVDALIVISNDKLLEVIDQKTSMMSAFRIVDEVLYQSIQGISTIITKVGYINSDFADIQTILKDSGTALIGIGRSSGENRVKLAVEKALYNPLLSGSFEGAKRILFNIAGNEKLTLSEVEKSAEIIRSKVDENAHIICGMTIDETLKDEIVITVVAAGFSKTVAIKHEDSVRKVVPFNISVSKDMSDDNEEDIIPTFIMNRR